MLKVAIADDEARVCRPVQILADWDALGMEVAGTAGVLPAGEFCDWQAKKPWNTAVFQGFLAMSRRKICRQDVRWD